MSIRTRIVVAVALHQIDYAPDTKPGSKCYNKGLQMASGALSPKKPQYGDPDYYSCNEGESL